MSRVADPLVDSFRALRAILEQTLEAYVAQRTLIRRRREAIRCADATRLEAILAEERQALVRIGEFDRKRAELVASLAKRCRLANPSANLSANLTVSGLAERAPEPEREHLLVLAAQLREEIDATRRESGVVRQAAEALADHVSGLLQSVQAALGGTKTYSRGGRLAVAVPMRTVDLRS